MKRVIILGIALVINGCAVNAVDSRDNLDLKSLADPNDKNPKIFTLPVGQGNCQLLTCPTSQKAMIFDCGSTGINKELKNKHNLIKWSKKEIVNRLVSIFDNEGIKRYNIILSHPDADHYNYITEIILQLSNERSLLPENVILGGELEDYNSESMNSLLTFLKMDKSLKVITFDNRYSSTPGAPLKELSCDKDIINSYILAANVGTKDNDKSIVVAVNIPEKHSNGYISNRFALFSGDMTSETVKFIKKNPIIYMKNVELVTAPHHGEYNTDVTKQLADATYTKVLLVSSGPRPDYGHPSCKRLNKFSAVLLIRN